MSNIIQHMDKINWIEIVNGLIGIWLAIVATIALKTWKHQSKAQKQTDFLDEITNSLHEFITLMGTPIEMLKFIEIGIESYHSSIDLKKNIENPVVITYIQKHGKEEGQQLFDYLMLCNPSLIKVSSLLVKGQVLDFKNYIECQNACNLITWQYDRIHAFCSIISRPSLNWENPVVQDTLSKVIQ